MVSFLKTKEERGPLWKFGSVQIGYAAAFGGLGFALRALGIGVPIAPGMLMDPRDVAAIVGSGFAGPIGAIIVGVLCALPSAVFAVQLYVPLTIGLAIMYHYLKHPWYYVGLAVFLLVAWNGWGSTWYVIWGFIPNFTVAYLANLITTVVYLPSAIIVIEALRKYSPTAKRVIG